MSSTKRKAASAVAAVGVAAALALGGTFAWQSISQTALNEASDVVNPGGRLHDDFYIDHNGDYNADVYVENFAEDEIFARVQLQEFMEIVVNQGVEGAEVVDAVVGAKYLADEQGELGEAVTNKATDNTSGYTYEYVTHYFDQANETDEYWDWTTGSADSAEVWYMPTFNKNKDSLVADRNGMYVDRIGGISNRGQQQYEDWEVWTEVSTEDGTEIYDADVNSVDEVKYDFENLQTYKDAGNIKTVEETHTARLVGSTKGLISMSEWLQMLEGDGGEYDESAHGSYWVYDEDGWVYWSSPIAGGETTGLLLDSIELNQVMDDTWYYAINAVGQFVTADDVGKSDNTGFYGVEDEKPSTNAETLLEAIGVDMSGEGASMKILELVSTDEPISSIYIERGESVKIVAPEGADLSTVFIDQPGWSWEDYGTYDADTQVLTLTGGDDMYGIYSGDSLYHGQIWFSDGGGDDEYYGDWAITVGGQGPDDDGYIYLEGLGIDQDNSFTVKVSEDFELAGDGLTAKFHEDGITGTTMVVSDSDPYSATLTIAARDHHSVEITATDVNGETETVTVVPVYSTVVITPDMDGETLILPSGYYSLRAEEFEPDDVTFTLTGAKRCNVIEDNGEQKLNVSSYESGTDITLAVSDGAQTANVIIVVADAHPYDGPIYTYYIKGKGETWSYAFMETQDYAWEQNDDYTYQIGAGMTNDFAGTIKWTIIDNMDTPSKTAYFVNGDDENGLTYTGLSPEVEFTAEQTQEFTILADIYVDQEKTTIMTDGEGNRYDFSSQYFTIYPTKSGKPVVHHMSVRSDEGTPIYLAPSETAEVYFIADIRTGGESISNADVTWSLEWAEAGCSFNIVEDESGDTATVAHTCTADSCTNIGAVRVVASYDHAYGQKAISEFYIIPADYAGDLEFDDGGGEGGGESGSTLAMAFESAPVYVERSDGTAYIEIPRNREEAFVWNLYGCSEREFTLSSSNESVTFEPYNDNEENRNLDMNIIIPGEIKESFTVTATSMDGTKSVTFTVVMSDESAGEE